MIFNLVKDFSAVLTAMPADHSRRRTVELLRQTIDLSTHILAVDPLQLGSQFWGRLAEAR